MATWRLIRNEGPVEWDGKHSIFVDVVDEQGRRLVGIPVTYKWADGPNDRQTKPSEAKPGEEFAMDFPMFNSHNVLSVWVDVPGDTSEIASGMGLVSFGRHVVYKLVFQRSADDNDVGEGPQIPSVPKQKRVTVFEDGVLKYDSGA